MIATQDVVGVVGCASFQATVMAAAILLFRRVLGDRVAPWVWCIGWSLVLLRLVVPVTPAIPLTVYGAIDIDGSLWSSLGDRVHTSPMPAVGRPLVVAGGSLGVPVAGSAGVTSSAAWHVLFAVWALGASVALVRDLGRLLAVRRLVARATPIVNDRAEAAMKLCCRAIGVSPEQVSLLASHDIATPAAVGLVHNRILVPASLAATLGPAEWQALIGHELGHFRRRDLWFGLVGRLALAIHWFNPIVRVVVARLNADRELACDALALRSAPSARDYGLALLAILERCPARGAPSVFAATMGSRASSEIERRVRAIAGERPAAWLTAAALCCITLTACTTLARPVRSPHPAARTTTRVTAEESRRPPQHDATGQIPTGDVDDEETELPGAETAVAKLGQPLEDCYNEGLIIDPALSVDGQLVLEVSASGTVTSATASTGAPPSMQACIERAGRQARFDPPPGATHRVIVPLQFETE